MEYIALLRGINVGKTKRIDMKSLKNLFERIGYINVSTYINSGNVFFESTKPVSAIRKEIKLNLQNEFGYDIPTLIKMVKELQQIVEQIPTTWLNDTNQRTDVAFLFDEIDSIKIIDELPIRKEFIDIRYTKGALFWNVKPDNYNKSHLNKLISHRLYQQMTIRNVNTVRNLAGKWNEV
jgi:uncharacterized protein (DUF1697 family)